MKQFIRSLLSLSVALSLFSENAVFLQAEETADPEQITEETEQPVSDDFVLELEPAEETETTGEIQKEETAEEVPAEEEAAEVTAEEPEENEFPEEEAIINEETEAEVPEEEVQEEVTADEPEETPVPEETEESDDFTTLAVGSDGVAYDGVHYLSVGAVSRMPEDARKLYFDLCDDISVSFSEEYPMENVVFAVDAYGSFKYLYQIPFNAFYEGGEWHEPAEEGDEPAVYEEPVNDEAEESPEEDAQVFYGNIVEENLDVFAELDIVPEEWIDEDIEYVAPSLMKDMDYFYNQLSSIEKPMYNAGYNNMVKKNGNSATVTGYGYSNGYERMDGYYWCDAYSALINTYPARFDWFDVGNGKLSVSGTYNYGSGQYKVTGKMTKSKHYSKSLETKAQAMVRQLVEEANDYAVTYYSTNPTYGIIVYLNNFITREYYNYTGTYDDYATRKSKEYYYCHTAYGSLLQGYGVCESFAKTVSRVLDEAGIRNIYVVGTAGGGHAWNYVQMPDLKWYMLDTTWNCNNKAPYESYAGSTTFLLSASDSSHYAEGRQFLNGKYFSYPTLSSAKYTASGESRPSMTTLASVMVMKPKEKLTPYMVPAPGNDAYYAKFPVLWTSSNPKVATVSSKGLIKAVAPGVTTITATFAGQKTSSTVYVYKFASLKFRDNAKTSLTNTYAVNGLYSTTTFTIDVNQTDRAASAYTIMNYGGLDAPTVKSSKPAVAEATATLSGDVINLRVTAYSLGTTTITVKFAGKKATLKLSVKQNIQSSWFDFSQIASVTYTGKAFKPKVVKSVYAPSDLKFKVTYANNKNAGTATVNVTGTGKYAGTVSRTFTIYQENLNNLNTKFTSCTAYKYFTGAAQIPKTVVKIGSRTLKTGTDYTVWYALSGSNSYTLAAPSSRGTYTVQIRGMGNYMGTLVQTRPFEIR